MALTETRVEIVPSRRRDLIDLTQQFPEEIRSAIAAHNKALYCSYHTTAGFLDQGLCMRLNHSPDLVDSVLDLFSKMFPPGADYEHDKMHLRDELSDEQKRKEPRNADSHLAFIGSGLRNCVTYHNREAAPVWFIDLDGVHEHGVRTREATALGYDHDELVCFDRLSIPVSSHPIDSVNLRDERLGLYEQIAEAVRNSGVERGRVQISLAADEHNVGLTVNEYETLLMQNDLREVLRNPMRFMAERGRSMLRDPRAVPGKALNYAKYDVVNALNVLFDRVGMSESIVERVVARFMAVPAARFLRMKRGVSMLIHGDRKTGPIVHGTYQSPILVQWRKADAGVRRLEIRVYRFS